MILINILCYRIDKYVHNDWEFQFERDVERGIKKRVDIPHTWNAQDGQIGKPDYYRGVAFYTKKYHIPLEYQSKRMFMRFDGVGSSCILHINDLYVGRHNGGYSQFIFEITNFVKIDAENSFKITVSNAPSLDQAPLSSNFNIYGGIYRNLHLIVTNDTIISPLDNASTGVYVQQQKVNSENADLSITTLITSQKAEENKNITIISLVYDNDKVVQQVNTTISQKQDKVTQFLQIKTPHLWNGVDDPFLYQLRSQILIDGAIVDEVVQQIGIRTFYLDSGKGFFLNNRSYKLNGAVHHQERIGRGNSLHPFQLQEDAKLLLDAGFNSARSGGYQVSQFMYELYDKNGIVAWAEIPFIRKFFNDDQYKKNIVQQLVEVLKQTYNHPSVIFVNLFNDLIAQQDSPAEFVKELLKIVNDTNQQLITVGTDQFDSETTKMPQSIGFNKFFGWGEGNVTDLSKYLDDMHTKYPEYKIALSEYGAGSSVYHQQEIQNATNVSSRYHPENYQTHAIIETYKQLKQKEFLWGSYYSSLFDYYHSSQANGQLDGVVDRGLITSDRMVKKDAFYFIKANLHQKDDVLHLADCRNIIRKSNNAIQLIFSNLDQIKISLNNVQVNVSSPDEFKIIQQPLTLTKGKNIVQIEASSRINQSATLTNSCVLYLE